VDAPDYKEIYDKHADQYELLVSREDYQPNIFQALYQIKALGGPFLYLDSDRFSV